MPVLMNPTNEMMSPMYAGVQYDIAADGGKVTVGEAAANHIINAYAPRGLCRLEYGDDEKKVTAQGLSRNQGFKTKMVMKYNQMSMARHQTGREYIPPTDNVRQYAGELGIKLEQPFVTQANENVLELSSIKKENAELKKQMATMMAKMEEFMANTVVEEAPARTGKGGRT